VYFDPDKLDSQERYKLICATIVPRPIAWVVSRSATGKLNAAPFSFFNVMSNSPPVVALGIGPRNGEMKDTAKNIRETGEFVVNLVNFPMVGAMNVTAMDFDAESSEIEEAGLTTMASTKIATPRIADSPVAFECTTRQTVDLGNMQFVVLGNIVAIHIADEAMLDGERCYVDTPGLDLVGRMHGGGWYSRTTDRFEVHRLDVTHWRSKKSAAD